jgi:hypothetical protein
MGYVWGIVNNICKGRGRYIGDKRGQKLKKNNTKKKVKIKRDALSISLVLKRFVWVVVGTYRVREKGW